MAKETTTSQNKAANTARIKKITTLAKQIRRAGGSKPGPNVPNLSWKQALKKAGNQIKNGK